MTLKNRKSVQQNLLLATNQWAGKHQKRTLQPFAIDYNITLVPQQKYVSTIASPSPVPPDAFCGSAFINSVKRSVNL